MYPDVHETFVRIAQSPLLPFVLNQHTTAFAQTIIRGVYEVGRKAQCRKFLGDLADSIRWVK
jgi:hypothetical protein